MPRIRHAARILLVDPDGEVLMFHFVYTDGPLAGSEYWGVPGGGVEEGESIPAAAVRELREETGMRVDAVRLGDEASESHYPFRLSTGEVVSAHDHFFVLRLPARPRLTDDGFTPEERLNMVEHRWWSLAEVMAADERIMPPDLAAVLRRTGIGAWTPDSITVTRADEADLPAILALQILAFQSQAALLNDHELPALQQTIDDTIREFRDGTVFLKAVDGGGTIVGSVRGTLRDGTLGVGKLIVHPRWRGLGLGARLLLAIEDETPAERCELFTSDRSLGNIRLYERVGYRACGTRDLNESIRLVVMEKWRGSAGAGR